MLENNLTIISIYIIKEAYLLFLFVIDIIEKGKNMHLKIDEYKMPLSVLSYRENLLNNLKFFNFEKISWAILSGEFERDQDLKDEIFELAIKFLDFDIDEFQNILAAKWETQDTDVQKLIDDQYERVKTMFISFIFDQLPFNYLIKISKKQGKYNLKENIRENLIELLNIEIQKLVSLDNTLDLLQEQMPETKRKNELNIATSKITNSYKKIIIENKMLIGIVRELSLNVLENLIDKYIDNKKVFSNLY